MRIEDKDFGAQPQKNNVNSSEEICIVDNDFEKKLR